MLRSPGSNRYCPEPVPEEVLLKLQLLGCKLIWEMHHWAIYPEGVGQPLAYVTRNDDLDWVLSVVADTIAKSRTPAGWTQTQQVDTMPIEAASCIAEDL